METNFKKITNNVVCDREECACYTEKPLKPNNHCRGLMYVDKKCRFYKKKKARP